MSSRTLLHSKMWAFDVVALNIYGVRNCSFGSRISFVKISLTRTGITVSSLVRQKLTLDNQKLVVVHKQLQFFFFIKENNHTFRHKTSKQVIWIYGVTTESRWFSLTTYMNFSEMNTASCTTPMWWCKFHYISLGSI